MFCGFLLMEEQIAASLALERGLDLEVGDVGLGVRGVKRLVCLGVKRLLGRASSLEIDPSL